MKTSIAIVIITTAWIIAYGSPFARQKPEIRHYYQSPEPILPMTFGHSDHVTVGCVDCHHNYVDDTGGEPCMYCHVTNPDVWPLLEEQFHELCRGCHAKLAAEGADGGPPRQCVGCHLADDLP